MSTECINAIYGRTVNGFNRNLSCGGSSGGEGALVGLRGSLLGFGSDIGGSIRVPSSFNGLYGLRGSYNRMPCASNPSNRLLAQLTALFGTNRWRSRQQLPRS